MTFWVTASQQEYHKKYKNAMTVHAAPNCPYVAKLKCVPVDIAKLHFKRCAYCFG